MGHKSSDSLYDHHKKFAHIVLGSGPACQPLLKEWLFNCLCVVIHASMTNKPKIRDLSEKETAL